MKPHQIAHVLFTPDSKGTLIECTVPGCGNNEHVPGEGADKGQSPEKFTILPFRPDGTQYIKCEKCGKLHDGPSPGR